MNEKTALFEGLGVSLSRTGLMMDNKRHSSVNVTIMFTNFDDSFHHRIMIYIVIIMILCDNNIFLYFSRHLLTKIMIFEYFSLIKR